MAKILKISKLYNVLKIAEIFKKIQNRKKSPMNCRFLKNGKNWSKSEKIQKITDCSKLLKFAKKSLQFPVAQIFGNCRNIWQRLEKENFRKLT